MRTIEIITLPQVQPGIEFTVDLPAQAQILKFVLRLEARAIQTVDGIRATVNPAVRVLVDRSHVEVPRRFIMLPLGSTVPDNADYVDGLGVTLPNNQRCELDLFEIRPSFLHDTLPKPLDMNKTNEEES